MTGLRSRVFKFIDCLVERNFAGDGGRWEKRVNLNVWLIDLMGRVEENYSSHSRMVGCFGGFQWWLG